MTEPQIEPVVPRPVVVVDAARRNLYLSISTIGGISVALGFNFLLTTPTFQQYGIPKNLIGAGFMSIGLAILLLLNVRRDLQAVRIALIVNIAYMLFWGIGTTQTFFEGTSSLQLFILYWGLAIKQIPLVLQPSFYGVGSDR